MRKEIRVFIYSLILSALQKQGSSALFSSLYMHVTRLNKTATRPESN